jgi:hypothetical protein
VRVDGGKFAACDDGLSDCAFEYAAHSTPLISAVEPSSGQSKAFVEKYTCLSCIVLPLNVCGLVVDD